MADWILTNTKANCAEIANALNISELSARLLVNRGIKTYEDARQFLRPDIQKLPDPFMISHMDIAVETVRRHIDSGSKIAVYGDYDVDGVMSAVILIKALNYPNLLYYVPDREAEGYGLNNGAVEKLMERGVNLIISCDNGITSIDEANQIYDAGMELVIIDHHEPLYDENRQERLPKAEAIVNPKKSGCSYPFKAMCAAGLCFRFSQAFGCAPPQITEFTIFAAIATICDVVDLLGDNRVIAKTGLSLIQNTNNVGLRALINRYELTRISTYHIGFILGPALNAGGRLESAKIATELFLTDDCAYADDITQKLYELNNARKVLTDDTYKELTASLPFDKKVFVLFSENIHESVAGIVAGRIKEKYNHPVIVLAKGKQYAKGSARSISGYDIFRALTDVSHLFIKYGGHQGAAGLTIPFENINELDRLLNDMCEITDFTPKLPVEARLPASSATFALAKELSVFEPFGKANKEPVFAEKNVRFKRVDFIGKDKNVIKLWLYNCKLSAIGFDLCDKFLSIAEKKLGSIDKTILSTLTSFELDIAFCVTINEYKGEKSVQLLIKDIR